MITLGSLSLSLESLSLLNKPLAETELPASSDWDGSLDKREGVISFDEKCPTHTHGPQSLQIKWYEVPG